LDAWFGDQHGDRAIGVAKSPAAAAALFWTSPQHFNANADDERAEGETS
jgi:hypothetical protein